MYTTATKSNAKTDHSAQPELAAPKPAAAHVSRRISYWAKTLPIQASLKVNTPGDKYEQEAERVASQVMRMGDPAVQRKTCACGKPMGPDGMCEDCKRKQQEKIQRMATGEVPQTAAPPIVSQVISQPGRPLDSATRNFMESRFGQSFDHVRTHTDPQAANSAEQINARAYASGNHIVFGPGQYTPQSQSGQQLLAHELVHVLQNGGANGTTSRRQIVSRYYIDDCDDSDRDLRSSADGRATAMAAKAYSTLKTYEEAYVNGNAKQSVTDLLVDHFGFEGTGGFLDVVIKNFQKIKNKFKADDYTYECEDSCDSEYAYVYWIWSDIHICINKLRKKGKIFAAHVFLHEMSHYIAGTDDTEYYYYGSSAEHTSLHPTDAIYNADSYEGFAAELYKQA